MPYQGTKDYQYTKYAHMWIKLKKPFKVVLVGSCINIYYKTVKFTIFWKWHKIFIKILINNMVKIVKKS